MVEQIITLRWDSRDLEVWRGGKVEEALRSALYKAGGDGARALKAGSSRLIRQRKRLKVSRVNQALVLRFPKKGAEISQLEWRMDVSGEPLRVADFPHRQTRRGVSVSINVGSRQLIKSAFVARMKSGHTGVFRRRGKERLPIDEAFTSRISDVFADEGFIPFVQAGAQARFTATFTRLLPLELRKLGG